MKRKDITALHDLDVAALQKKLAELTEQFAKVKLEKKVGKVANRRLASTLADDIARVKTILAENMMKATV